MKAAFVCARVVEVRSSQTLAEQLGRYGSGFELKTISNVPQGSGETLCVLLLLLVVVVCVVFVCIPL